MCVLHHPFPIVCIIIPLTPRSAEGPFILQTPSSFFPSLTPTPPPTPLTTTATLHRRPSSTRRSPSYESSISSKDLAPLAPFEPSQSNSRSFSPSFAFPQGLPGDPCLSPFSPLLPDPLSPIPLITSPLLSPSASHSLPPITSSAFSISSSSYTAAVSPVLTTQSPKSFQREPNSSSLALSGHRSDISCHTTATFETSGTPTPFTQQPSSESITLPVSPMPSSPSCSRPVSPLSLSTHPLVSPSGSLCPSPGPSSPPLRSLSPCHCTCVLSIPPPPTQGRTDPSTMEILI